MFISLSIDYDFDFIINANYNSHSGSCITHQAKEIPEVYQDGKHVSTFCTENTTIHQLWWSNEQIDYGELANLTGIDIVSISSIKQDPGHCIPYHKDMFYKIKKKYPESDRTIVRYNLFLENYKLGHFLQATVDGNHFTVPNWKKNDGYIFDQTVYHLSANAGLEPKYTLQISGFLQS